MRNLNMVIKKELGLKNLEFTYLERVNELNIDKKQLGKLCKLFNDKTARIKEEKFDGGKGKSKIQIFIDKEKTKITEKTIYLVFNLINQNQRTTKHIAEVNYKTL